MKTIRKTFRWLVAIAGAYVFVSFVNATFWIFAFNGRFQKHPLEWLAWLGTALGEQIAHVLPQYLAAAAIMLASVALVVFKPNKFFASLKAAVFATFWIAWASLLVEAIAAPLQRETVWSLFTLQLWIFLSLYWNQHWEAHKAPFFNSEKVLEIMEWLGFEPETPGNKEADESAEASESQNPGKGKHNNGDKAI